MASTTSSTQPIRRFIKRQAVEEITGLSCSEIYRRIAAGTFPAQVILGPKSVVWIESEVMDWCDARVAESRGGRMTLAIPPCWRYGLPVTVNPVAGFGDPMSLAHKRPNRQQALFCACRSVSWRLCVGDLRVCRVPRPRFANLRTAASITRLATGRGSSISALELTP